MTLQEILTENRFPALILPIECSAEVIAELTASLTKPRKFQTLEPNSAQHSVILITEEYVKLSTFYKQLPAEFTNPVFQLHDSTWARMKPAALLEVLTHEKVKTPSLADLVKRQRPVLVILPKVLVCDDVAVQFDFVLCDYLPLEKFNIHFVLGLNPDELSPVNLTESLRKDIQRNGLTLDHLKTFPVYLTPADKWEPKLLQGEELETFYKEHFCTDLPEEPAETTVWETLLMALKQPGDVIQLILPIRAAGDVDMFQMFATWLNAEKIKHNLQGILLLRRGVTPSSFAVLLHRKDDMRAIELANRYSSEFNEDITHLPENWPKTFFVFGTDEHDFTPWGDVELCNCFGLKKRSLEKSLEENPILDDVLNGMPVQVIMPIHVHSEFINWLHTHTKGLRKIHDFSRFYGDMKNRHAVVLLADENNLKSMLAITQYDDAIFRGGVRNLQIPEAFYLPALIWSELKRLSEDELIDFFHNELDINIITGEFVYPTPTDNVNHPAHYAAGKIETIDFIEDKGFNFRIGNVIKYVSRHDKKHSEPEKQLEDLKKAAWYLEREIKAREDALLSRGNG